MVTAGSGNPIDIGLVGLGSWAKEAYVPALVEESGVTVRAVAARTEETRRAALRLFGKDTELYADYTALLEGSQVEAVMIGLPPELSAKAALEAVEADKHVFVEPPFGVGGDSDRLLDAAEGAATVFHVDVELRYLPVVEAMRELLHGGVLGRLLLVRAELANDWARGPDSGNPFLGSQVFSLGPWYVDLLDAVADADPSRVDVFGSYLPDTSHMVTGTATIQFASAAVGEWAFNLTANKELELRLKVTGTEGEAEADLVGGSYRYRAFDSEWRLGSADCARPEHGFVGLRESVSAFLAAVRGEGSSRSGAGTYRRLHAGLTSLRQSETERHWVGLPAGPGEDA